MATATQSERAMEAASFPFLDLPPGLRLMVYKRIPRTLKHIHVKVDYPPVPEAERSMTFVLRSLPMSILATCKLVNSEARDIVTRLATEFVLKATSKVLCTTDSHCDLTLFLNSLFFINFMEPVSYFGTWLEDKSRAVPITTSVYLDRDPPVRMHHHDFFLQDALEQQNLEESFMRWMKQTSLQHGHHRRAKTLHANEVVVKMPSVAVMKSFEALGFSYDDNFRPFCENIFFDAGCFAVAGFQSGEEDDADQSQLPTYDDTTDPIFMGSHYHIRDNQKVFGRLD